MPRTASSSSPSSGRGSIRIAGVSTTSAPSSRRRAASPLACARARVTATTSPWSGRRSSQAIVSRSPATGPTSVIAGGRTPSASTRAAMPASVSTTVRCPGCVPRSTTAAGSWGSRPRRREPLGDQRQVLDAHVEHERAGEARERVPVERRLGLLRVLVAGHEGDRRRGVAVGHRNPRVRRRGHAGRHAGHDLERARPPPPAPRPPRRRARTRTGRRPSGAPRACPPGRAPRAAR